MRFKFLATATSALALVALTLLIQMGEDSDAPSAPPMQNTANRLADFQKKLPKKPRRGLVERLADDPRAALEWLLQTSAPEQRSQLSVEPHLQSAVVDAANRLLQAAHPQWGKNDPTALENFIQLWAAADLVSAYDWAHQIAPGPVRDALMARIAFSGSQSDPNSAAWLVVEEIPPGPIHEEAVVMVLHQWALQDPSSAMAWVELFPHTPLRDRVLSELQGVISYQK